MTLEKHLLEKLASFRPETVRDSLRVEADGWKATLSVEAIDTLGVKLWEVQLERTRPAALAVPLADQARGIADRVKGLLEPLRVLEIDGESDVALLRSSAASSRGEALHYYEIERRSSGQTSLRRFESTPSAKREQISYTLTHEVLARLVEDLIG